jgi:hypothetical protein
MEDAPVDLRVLSNLFAPAVKVSRIAKVPRLKKLTNFPKRSLKLEDVRRMYMLRHGSEELADANIIRLSYEKIAKKLHIPFSTVYYALNRYERQGCKWVNLK